MSELSWVDEAGTLHDKGKLLFLIGDSLIGESPFDPGSAPGLHYRRQGVCYFCPECGSIWGRITLVESNGRQASYEVWTVSCEKHPDQWNKAGSFLAHGLTGILKHIPASVAKRELELRGEISNVS